MCERARRTYMGIPKRSSCLFEIRESQIVFQKLIGKFEVRFPPIHPGHGLSVMDLKNKKGCCRFERPRSGLRDDSYHVLS